MAIFNSKDAKQLDARGGSGDAILSIVAAGMRVVGDIDGPGLLKIDGVVEGSVSGVRQIIIGRDGSIRGNVHATEVVHAGTIDGSIIANERVEVQGTAMVNGDIQTRVIVVHEGARINGTVRMSSAAASESADRPAVQVMR